MRDEGFVSFDAVSGHVRNRIVEGVGRHHGGRQLLFEGWWWGYHVIIRSIVMWILAESTVVLFIVTAHTAITLLRQFAIFVAAKFVTLLVAPNTNETQNTDQYHGGRYFLDHAGLSISFFRVVDALLIVLTAIYHPRLIRRELPLWSQRHNCDATFIVS